LEAKLKLLLLAMLGMALSTPLFAQVESCPTGTEDMMNYFVMGYPNRLSNNMGPGNANPVYTNIVPELGSDFASSGYFLWTKSAVGYPWDVKTFDQSYIYDRTTELSWTDATAFKRFNIDLPLSKRCVAVGKSGGTIRVDASKTDYTSYANCLPTQTQNLGYVVNMISAPVAVNTRGNLGTVLTRNFTYRYSCDSTYANCQYQEIFALGYQVGLYDWKYYQGSGGKYHLVQESKINQFVSGSATPYLPCTTSYQ
jgi:hypothetical protein